MPYENLGGVRAVYMNGSLHQTRVTTQPRVLVIGTGTSGLCNEIFNVTDLSVADTKFGAASDLMKGAFEVFSQGADNIALMRVGGKRGSFTLEDADGNIMTITPNSADDEIMERYALIMSNDGVTNRALVYDLEDEVFVFDSQELEALSSDAVTVEGLEDLTELFEVGDINDPTSTPSLADLVTGDFVGTAPTDLTAVEGTDGTNVSLAEKYAAFNTGYFGLDYKDAPYILPVGVYVDEDNIADEAAANKSANPSGATNDIGRYGLFWKGPPVAGSDRDLLGFLWQYVYQGQIFTYMLDTSNHFSDLGNAAAATRTVSSNIVLTAQKDGKGGNAITIQVNAGASAGVVVTITETTFGFDILVEGDNGTDKTDAAVTAINDALEAFTLSTGVLASTLVVASGGSSGQALTSAGKANLTGGRGGAVLTPDAMQGITVPTAVSDRFDDGADAEIRECNFAHQLASFAYLASVNWQDCIGAISFKEPVGYGRTQISSHYGVAPTYLDNGREEYIDAPADNGSGILGYKYLAGSAISTGGYRAARITDGGTNDGLAYGGFILTKGASLPNGTKWPYGISDADEALDSRGNPIDIGSHIITPADWVVHRNGFNGGSVYRSTICGLALGKLATLSPEIEPIGQNGRVANVSLGRRVHSTQLDSLTALRIPMLRVEEGGTALTFTTLKTAALPDSDYSRISTIRSVNRHLADIRTICRPFIGQQFSSKVLTSMQAAIDKYLNEARTRQWNGGARATIRYDRASKILGRLYIILKIVPPFAIEAITIETAIAADESEL